MQLLTIMYFILRDKTFCEYELFIYETKKL